MLIETAVDDPSSGEETHDGIAVDHQPRLGRRARMLVVTVVVALVGGGVWWHHAVAADPGLSFDGAAVSNNWRTVFAGQDYGPFRPFRLRPGETRFLRLDFHTATCDPAGLQDGFSRIVSLPVRYRTLGVTRTATVPIDQVSVAIRTIGICDHPLETSLR